MDPSGENLPKNYSCQEKFRQKIQVNFYSKKYEAYKNTQPWYCLNQYVKDNISYKKSKPDNLSNKIHALSYYFNFTSIIRA